MEALHAALLAAIAALLLANLPFVTSRPLAGQAAKGTAQRLAEVLVLYACWMALCIFLEGKVGKVHDKDWSLWPISLAFFAVLTFPGVTYRYLWHARKS